MFQYPDYYFLLLKTLTSTLYNTFPNLNLGYIHFVAMTDWIIATTAMYTQQKTLPEDGRNVGAFL